MMYDDDMFDDFFFDLEMKDDTREELSDGGEFDFSEEANSNGKASQVSEALNDNGRVSQVDVNDEVGVTEKPKKKKEPRKRDPKNAVTPEKKSAGIETKKVKKTGKSEKTRQESANKSLRQNGWKVLSICSFLISLAALTAMAYMFLGARASTKNVEVYDFQLPYCAWYGRQSISADGAEYVDEASHHASIMLYAPEQVTVECDNGYNIRLYLYETDEMSMERASGQGKKVSVPAGEYYIIVVSGSGQTAARELADHVHIKCSYTCSKYYEELFYGDLTAALDSMDRSAVQIDYIDDLRDSFRGGFIYTDTDMMGLLSPHTYQNRAVSTRVFSLEKDVTVHGSASATVWVLNYDTLEYQEINGGSLVIPGGSTFTLGVYTTSEDEPYSNGFYNYILLEYPQTGTSEYVGYVNLDRTNVSTWFSLAAPEDMPSSWNRQGSDIYENFRVQLYSKPHMSIIDYENNTLLAVVDTFDYGHANAVCFSRVFYNEDDPMPLLYISDWYKKIVHVTRIYQDDTGEWTVDRVGTYTFDDAPYEGRGGFAVDNLNNTLYGIAWSEGSAGTEGNHWVLTRWALPEYGDDVAAILDEDYTFTLPKQSVIQGCCYVNGQLFILLSYTSEMAKAEGTFDSKVVVVDTTQKRITAELRYTDYTTTKVECEDVWIEPAGDTYLLCMVTAGNLVYKLQVN